MWASGWLAFRLKATKLFPSLDFNFQVLDEWEAEESDFDDEADLVVLSDVPSSVPLPGEPKTKAPTEASSPTSVPSTSPSDLHGLEIQVTEAAQSPTLDI